MPSRIPKCLPAALVSKHSFFVLSVLFLFLIFYICFALFLSWFVCCTACRITSRGGYTTATRWGVFLLHPSVLSLLFLDFFRSIYLLLCSYPVSLSVSFSIYQFIFCYSFILFLISYIYFFCFFVLIFCLFQCIGVAGVCTICCACHSPEQWLGIVLLILLPTWYNVATCVVVW